MHSDAYVWQARIVPATITVLPAIMFGILLGSKLDGLKQLWAVASFALIPLASAFARQAGNRVQEQLWAQWGGAPGSKRLWISHATAPGAVRRRRSDVEAVLPSVALPTEVDEHAKPAEVEAEYRAVVHQLIGVLRSQSTDLMTKENANYGFARNLFGLKPWAIVIALAVLAGSIAIPVLGPSDSSWDGEWWLSGAVAVISLIAWPFVTPGFVRPAADAWADRLYEAVHLLAGSDA